MTKELDEVNLIDLIDSICKDDKYTPIGKIKQIFWLIQKTNVTEGISKENES